MKKKGRKLGKEIEGPLLYNKENNDSKLIKMRDQVEEKKCFK